MINQASLKLKIAYPKTQLKIWKGKPKHWEKNVVIRICDKGLTSRIYKELLYIKERKPAQFKSTQGT